MSDQPDQAPKKRGEAAWKAAKEQVAERNAAVRKEGKQLREAEERKKIEARRELELRQMAQLLDKQS
jgi:hypothetical protein